MMFLFASSAWENDPEIIPSLDISFIWEYNLETISDFENLNFSCFPCFLKAFVVVELRVF